MSMTLTREPFGITVITSPLRRADPVGGRSLRNVSVETSYVLPFVSLSALEALRFGEESHLSSADATPQYIHPERVDAALDVDTLAINDCRTTASAFTSGDGSASPGASKLPALCVI